MNHRILFVIALAVVTFAGSSIVASGIVRNAASSRGPCGGIGECWPPDCTACDAGGVVCYQAACCNTYLQEVEWCFSCGYSYPFSSRYQVYWTDYGCHEPCSYYEAWICFAYGAPAPVGHEHGW